MNHVFVLPRLHDVTIFPPVRKLPAAVLSGCLGVGKTTLLDHILRHCVGGKVVVIDNDMSEVNIDADLVENVDAAYAHTPENGRNVHWSHCCTLP